MKTPIAVFLILLFTASFTLTAQKRLYTAADHAKLEMPAGVRLSPDGSQIAYTVRSANTEASKWITQIFVTRSSDHRTRQFTSGVANSIQPQWSPDGRMISFVSKRQYLDDAHTVQSKGIAQLFVIPSDGGEAVALTKLESNVEEYAWSPDGRTIAILTEAAKSDSAQSVEDAKERKKMDWTSSLDAKQGRDLLVLDVSTKKIRTIATLDAGATELAWAPDGSRLVYETNYTGEYNDEQKYDLWTVDMAGTTRQLTSLKGPETHPLFSPDGKHIACITQTVPDIEFAKTELSVMDADGAHFRTLTTSYPYSVTRFEWSPDGESILALVNERTSQKLCRIRLSDGKVEPELKHDQYIVSGFSIAKNGLLALEVESPSMLKEVAIVKGGAVEILTEFSKQCEPFRFGESEVITVKSRDGKFDIDAVVVKPVDYQKGKAYPLLLAYHGGPYGEFDNKLYQYYPVQLLAQHGVMTVMPNVRGSSGYTDAFSQSNRYDLGGADYRDAMDVVEYLIREGLADSTRLGVTGGSYGGYMTNWTITQTQRFKAAVSMYGIFSWFTDWSNSFQPSFEQMYFGYNYWERPIDMNNLWIKTAPQTYVKNITTPTLILQGTEDQYTNISNSREMYAALKELNRTVEFVVYPRAEHGLRTEPNQYINVLERSVDWLMKYAFDKK